MFARLFLLFSIVPFIELFLLLTVGREIGVVPTVLMIILTALIGAALAKREGLRVYTEWQRAIAEMRVPDEGITSGLLVLVGGALMIAPGVLTDIVGILLMIAPIRRVVARWIEARVRNYIESAPERAAAGGASAGPGVFTWRVVTGAPFDPRARRPAAAGTRRVVRPSPRVIEADGVVIEERRPDTKPAAAPDAIEGEIVE
jgi:UPF0716 protein FxsA